VMMKSTAWRRNTWRSPRVASTLDLGSLFASDKIADLCEFHPELYLCSYPRRRRQFSVRFHFPLSVSLVLICLPLLYWCIQFCTIQGLF
jgi:hypothetical protein